METRMTSPAEPRKGKMKKGTIIAFGAGTLVLLGGYLVFVRRDKNGNTLWDNWTRMPEKPIEKVDTPDEAPPAGTSNWADESFPLKKGMYGGHIKNLQRALGFTGDAVDGKFGSATESAVKSKFGTTTVTKPQYNSAVNPTATGGGTNYENLKKNLGSSAHDFKSGVFANIKGKNTTYQFMFYTNGRVFLYDVPTKKEIKRGTYSEGGVAIAIDGGKTYSPFFTIGRSGKELLNTNMKDIIDDIGG